MDLTSTAVPTPIPQHCPLSRASSDLIGVYCSGLDEIQTWTIGPKLDLFCQLGGEEVTNGMLVLGGTLFDGTSRDRVDDSGIRVEGNRFTAVGRKEDFGQVLGGEPVIDATGHYLMPGLIDGHFHVMASWFTGPIRPMLTAPAPAATIRAVRTVAVALAKGVTTARDLGGMFEIPMYIRDAINRNEIPGPRLIVCGMPISATGGHSWYSNVEADGADEFRKAARQQLKAGVDFVKVMTSHEPWTMPGPEQNRPEVSLEEMKAAFDVAHDWGRFACCHATSSTAIARALEAGVDFVEHGHNLTDELAWEMVNRNVVLTPTLSVYNVQIMSQRVTRGEPLAAPYETMIPSHQAAFKAALRAGVMMTVGTDTLGVYAEEVDLMRRMGMTPRESLLACTAKAAQALRMDADIGTVEEGKVADLVVLRADPMEDSFALDEVELVIKDGEVYRPAELTFVERRAPSPTIMELACRERPTE